MLVRGCPAVLGRFWFFEVFLSLCHLIHTKIQISPFFHLPFPSRFVSTEEPSYSPSFFGLKILQYPIYPSPDPIDSQTYMSRDGSIKAFTHFFNFTLLACNNVNKYINNPTGFKFFLVQNFVPFLELFPITKSCILNVPIKYR